MVYLWTYEHLLDTPELEVAMEFAMEEVLGRCELLHHDDDSIPHDWRAIHIAQGAH